MDKYWPREAHPMDTADRLAALEAALPYLLASAWDDGHAAGYDRGVWEEAPVGEEPPIVTNPYKDQP